jgi:putative ABC transport system ATP-binding protein
VILCLEEVRKSYPRVGRERVALDGVSLEVDGGEMVGVFGSSGSGKSTLLRIAAGLQKPDGGAVLYRGQRLEQMSGRERKRLRRREIACVWAGQPLAEGLSVLDHVAIPLLVDSRDHHAAERQARETLLACEAEEYAEIGVHELSGGERQRVEIARALVSEPRLLLADGAAAGLSLVEQEGIMALLGSLAREAKVAVLITDTNAGTLIGANPVLYLSAGKLVNQEPTSERGQLLTFPRRAARAAADA